jgi:sugar phosphate permease
MLYALPLVFLIKDLPRSSTSNEVKQLNPAQSLFLLVTNFSFILLVLCFTLPAMSAWIVRDWMPAILKDVFKLQQGEAGVASTLYWQLAAIVGAIVGGWLADRWMLRHQRGRIFVSSLGMCMMVPAIVGMGNAPTLIIAVMFLMLFGLGWGFFDCNNMPILCQIVRPELRATGYGIMNFVSISCGGLADWGFGALRDRAVPLNIIFSVFASAAILSIVIVLLIKPSANLSDQPQRR